MDNQKKKIQFNIIKNDPTDGHKGFGAGSLSLENISPIMIDVEAKDAYVEIGALHARSPVERGIKFLKNKDEVPNGKPYWIVWVAIERNEEGPYYAGVTACEMTVDRSIRRGYKSLPEHVNNLDKAMKRKYITNHMDADSKLVLKEFLQKHDPSMWERSGEELKQQLS